jgi:hypothetical protein
LSGFRISADKRVPLVARTLRQPPPHLGLAAGRMIAAMILHKGKVLCALCGVEIDVTLEQGPFVVIMSSSGKPNIRTIMLESKDLHACPMGTAWEKRARR